MDTTALHENFGLPGILVFETHGELVRAVVTTPAASATVYLQGAHLAEWQPTGERSVLFMSGNSAFKKGKAIRGGVPVIFPWFGDRHDGKAGPAHGFARTEEWTFAFAALAGEDVHLTFTLAPNDASKSLGFDHFRVAYEVIVGRRLTMRLTVFNEATTVSNEAALPLVFEEALHTYFAVGDVRESSVAGLDGVAYVDKRDGGALKTQTDTPLVLTRDTDRVYLKTTSTCVIDDAKNKRSITVEKTHSETTIVWNPWSDLTAKMADMEPDGWLGMLCIESANAGAGSITLAPGAAHTMECVVSVETHAA